MDPSMNPQPVDRTPSPASAAWLDLYWLPLGADGSRVVRACGRLYERLAARRAGRSPRSLYHAALKAHLECATYVIEVAPVWSRPEPDRGVVAEGAVGGRMLGRTRWFRYEVRCWRHGVLPDEEHAVGSPVRLTTDPDRVAAVLDLAGRVPRLVWGRDELGTGEMWNSNSVIAWLLAGIGGTDVDPPIGGRAPGWAAGLVAVDLEHGAARGPTSSGPMALPGSGSPGRC
jgi:hypothetical protein